MRNYFGTNLYEHGHYFWELEGDTARYKSLHCKGNIPFSIHPEDLIGISFPRGTVAYFNIDGYSVCAISGSCVDTRPGSKSVFFFKGKYNQEELIRKIKSIPAACKIIKQIPFEIKW